MGARLRVAAHEPCVGEEVINKHAHPLKYSNVFRVLLSLFICWGNQQVYNTSVVEEKHVR